jgi:hypothetical protein
MGESSPTLGRPDHHYLLTATNGRSEDAHQILCGRTEDFWIIAGWDAGSEESVAGLVIADREACQPASPGCGSSPR